MTLATCEVAEASADTQSMLYSTEEFKNASSF